MRRYKVTQPFPAKELNGLFTKMITTGEELQFLRWSGGENEQSAVFALLVNDSQRNGLIPGPQFEVARHVFDASTEAMQE